jgi:hypothetical protein
LSYLQIFLALSEHPELGLSFDDAISDHQKLLPVDDIAILHIDVCCFQYLNSMKIRGRGRERR